MTHRILTFLWLVFLFLAAAFIANAEAATRFEVKQMVISEASDSIVPVPLALAVAKVESDFNEEALSSAGARGVMQIMPATAKLEFGVHPNRLWDPKINIRLGVQFLEQLHDQYNGRWDLALSHYNGGTVKGNTPHKRTRKYIQMVTKWQRVYQEQASLWEETPPANDLPYGNEDDVDVAHFDEWRKRPMGEEETENWILEEDEDDFFAEEDTIIIVERGDYDRRWARPAPPPRRYYGSGGHRRPPPPHHRRHFR